MKLPAGKCFMAFQSYVTENCRKSCSCYYVAGVKNIESCLSDFGVFSWSVISLIRTEHGDLRSKSSHENKTFILSLKYF